MMDWMDDDDYREEARWVTRAAATMIWCIGLALVVVGVVVALRGCW